MKSEVRFLHKFLKSIGFSEYTTTRKIQELVKDVIMNPESRNYTTLNGNEDTVLVEFCKNFAENMGIAVCGEFDENDIFLNFYRKKGVVFKIGMPLILNIEIFKLKKC